MAEQESNSGSYSSDGYAVNSHSPEEHGPPAACLGPDALLPAQPPLARTRGPVTPYQEERGRLWRRRQLDVQVAIRRDPDSHPLLGDDHLLMHLRKVSGNFHRLHYSQLSPDNPFDLDAISKLVDLGNTLLELEASVVPSLLLLISTDPAINSIYESTLLHPTYEPYKPAFSCLNVQHRGCKTPRLVGYCLSTFAGAEYGKWPPRSQQNLATFEALNMEERLKLILSESGVVEKVLGYVCSADVVSRKRKQNLCRQHCRAAHEGCYYGGRVAKEHSNSAIVRNARSAAPSNGYFSVLPA